MRHGRIRFSPDDRALHRICERRGWTIAEFLRLPEPEQIELLARDSQRQQTVSDILETLVYIEDGKTIVKDMTSYFTLFMEML